MHFLAKKKTKKKHVFLGFLGSFLQRALQMMHATWMYRNTSKPKNKKKPQKPILA
jgi:hypothetical protein